MDLILTGITAGVLGTLVMDLLNFLFARTGIILNIDASIIGRMSAGWIRGRFRYNHPEELVPVENEILYGYITHYAIGVGLAVTYVLGWDILLGGPASPVWALIYGIATTAASWFFVYPSLGLGAFGRKSENGIRSTLSALANHLFFGAGMAVAIALL
jgi:uncharacterized membrane protein YeaQ/YmgE (transglycosylase-associated protein family)